MLLNENSIILRYGYDTLSICVNSYLNERNSIAELFVKEVMGCNNNITERDAYLMWDCFNIMAEQLDIYNRFNCVDCPSLEDIGL